ncbi:MAG: hypothetical protein ABIS69_09650 [Sediminibacterium sp.]
MGVEKPKKLKLRINNYANQPIVARVSRYMVSLLSHYCLITVTPLSHHHRTTIVPPSYHYRTTIAILLLAVGKQKC